MDKLTGKNIEAVVDEYSEVYGEILLGIHRELLSQKEKLDTLEDEVAKLEKLNEVLDSDLKLDDERDMIVKLARKLAENLKEITVSNVQAIEELKEVMVQEFKDISNSTGKLTLHIDTISSDIGRKLRIGEGEIISRIKRAINSSLYEIQKGLRITVEKQEENHDSLEKLLKWNRALLVLVMGGLLTVLGVIAWKVDLLF